MDQCSEPICKAHGKRITALRGNGKELRDELRQLRRLVKEAVDYLDTNHLTNIAHGSILHQKLVEAVRP